MKNLIKFFMVMAVLCMTACSQTFEDVSNNAKPQEKTQGRLVMNVGNRSRTIMPIIAADDIKSATLTANNTEIRNWNGDNVIGQIESDNSILLDVGTYNFEIVFCNGTNDVILSGTINNQEIKTGNNSLTFDMQISTTGKGNISIELSRGADSGISKIKAGLYNIATGEVVENYEPEELTISGTQWTYSKDNVPAGQYIIKFEVYDVSDKLLNTLTDVIEVIGGVTTTAPITLNNINTQYYTITYNLDGGNWQNGFIPITVRNANTKVTLPTAEDIERVDYDFVGWYDENGDKITEIPSDTIEDITVTAGWKTTADTVATAITALSGEYTHYIIVSGAITSDTISAIKTALKNNSSVKVNLDLSGTTGLNKLPSYAFSECSNLTSVTIGDSVTSIGNYAFYYCRNLTSVTIPDYITEIASGTFYGCSSLTSVTIPDSVTSIGNYAFYCCRNLTSVTIPNSVISIGERAFSYCSSLTSMTIPDSVTSIGDYAFCNCLNLTSVTIPDSVTSIDDYAFNNCSSLTNFNVSENNKNYSTDGKILYNKDKTTLIVYPSATGEVTISDSVTSIGSYAFNNCSSLESVTIPDSVTTIGSYAFYYCSSLESVTIPDSVTSIGSYAFNNCSSLESVTIPDSVTTIGSYAFRYCSSLTSVTIGNNVTTIGNYAFRYCSSLTSVTIGNNVTTIGNYAFGDCNNLTSINYKGSQEQWEQINIVGYNGYLTNATINYNYTE